MATKFGALLKKHRLAQGKTLREFCLVHGFDPGNYSRLERGLFPPPQDRALIEKYATALGLQRGSDQWLELFDAAAIERGQIPVDLLSNKDLVAKLPVLFCAMRNKQISPEKLDKLIAMIN